MSETTPPQKSQTEAAAPDGRVEVRRRAITLLVEAESTHQFIDDILARTIHQVDERNRTLLQEIVYGVVRHMATLDAILGFYLKVPVTKQRPAVRAALRVGAYQSVFLSRIPAHAAVYQTVEGLKRLDTSGARAVGFANAVLHRLSDDVLRKQSDPPLDPDDPAVLPIRRGYCFLRRPVLPLVRLDRVGHVALKYSHPKWLVAAWIERFGEEEARELCAAGNTVPPVGARITKKAPSRQEVMASLQADGVDAECGALENSIRIWRSGHLARASALQKGWLQVQDETAIQIGAVLKPPAGARVLDLCAAPGGKAMQLLERLEGEGHLVAVDRREERLSLLRSNLDKVNGSYSVVEAPEDPSQLDLGETFTHIIVDAPCSNTGVLARRPEARWRLRRSDFENLAKLQRSLLDAAYRHLRPGGKLLYSTCSIESIENETVVAEFVAAHPDLTELETKLFLPHRTPGDGGFYSLLLRARDGEMSLGS